MRKAGTGMDKLKILVVDDESRMRKLVKDFLTKSGYEVLEAGDGEEAVDLFYKEKGHRADYSGCDDAEDGWVAGLPGNQAVFEDSGYYAHGKE